MKSISIILNAHGVAELTGNRPSPTDPEHVPHYLWFKTLLLSVFRKFFMPRNVNRIQTMESRTQYFVVV